MTLHIQSSPHYLYIHSPQLLVYGFDDTKRISLRLPISSITVTKTIRTHLGYPYGVCSHYHKSNNNTLSAVSHIDCIRRCKRYYYFKEFKCLFLTIDRFLGEYDIQSERICDRLEYKEFRKICYQKCHKIVFQSIIRITSI